ncbi:hypothetical protein [Flindersiella endophytica]
MQQQGFPPPVDSSELRPKRMWFLVAAGIALAGIVAGVAMLVYGIGGIAQPMDKTFDEGETVTARLDQNTAIYLATDETVIRTNCTATSADGKPVQVDPPGYAFTKTADGRDWRLIGTVRITTPGDYDLACTESPGPYALADEPDVSRFVIGLVALFVVSGLGILVGGIIAIVVGVKRSNHRRRLTDERLRGQAGPTGRPGPA